jgi:hypothetical protein
MGYHFRVQVKQTNQQLVHDEFRFRLAEMALLFGVTHDIGKKISSCGQFQK